MTPSTNRQIRLLVQLTIFVQGVFFGVALQYFRIPSTLRNKLFSIAAPHTHATPATHGVFYGDDSVERSEVSFDRLKSKRIMVALVFGQSNSANHGDTRHTPGSEVFNFYLGHLYHARDPLLGATGDGGSVWTRLGDMIVESGMYDAVVFAPIGVGASTIQRWAPGGDCHPDLIYTLRDLRDRGIPCTHLLWHQGEADHSTSQELYTSRFKAMVSSISNVERNASILVSIATRQSSGTVLKAIQDAQTELIDPAKHIYAGPNTDELGNDFRNANDNIHFNDQGLYRCAQLWLNVIKLADDQRKHTSE